MCFIKNITCYGVGNTKNILKLYFYKLCDLYFLKLSKKCPKKTFFFLKTLQTIMVLLNFKKKRKKYGYPKYYPKLSKMDNYYPLCPFLSIFGQL